LPKTDLQDEQGDSNQEQGHEIWDKELYSRETYGEKRESHDWGGVTHDILPRRLHNLLREQGIAIRFRNQSPRQWQ